MFILTGIDSNYIVPLCGLLGSLKAQPGRGEIRWYVLSSGVDEASSERFARICRRSCVDAELFDVDSEAIGVAGLRTQRGITGAAYLKLCAPAYLPCEANRAVILDADTIVEGDLRRLWTMDMGGSLLCAVQDYGCPYVSYSLGLKRYQDSGLPADTPYFNSGVMLVDVEQWRDTDVTGRCLAYLRDNAADLRCHDQEALNAVLNDRWQRLDPRWNQMPRIHRLDAWPPSPFREGIRERRAEIIAQPYLIHFSGPDKPWLSGCTHPARRRFLHYVQASGWFSEPEYLVWRFRLNRSRGKPTLRIHEARTTVTSGERPRAHAPERYRAFGLTVTPLSRDHVLVRSGWSGVARAMPHAAFGRLSACKNGRELDQHAIAICRVQQDRILEDAVRTPSSHSPLKSAIAAIARWVLRQGFSPPVSSEELESTRGWLNQFVRDGFLVAENEISARIRSLAASLDSVLFEQPAITALAVPTCGRPSSLGRCLSSYIANLRRHGRESRVIVVDDSRDSRARDANQQVIRAVVAEWGLRIDYVDRSRRVAFAQELARRVDVNAEISRFALLGDERCDLSFGAARNTLQLLTATELVVHVDDDTVCELNVPPATRSGLALDSTGAETEYWFLENGIEPIGTLDPVNMDYLGVHEDLLGSSIAHVLARAFDQPSSIDCERMSPEFLDVMTRTDARIAVTLLGSTGDSGMDINWRRLLLEGHSFERLVSDYDTYRRRSTTRRIIRSVTRRAITDASFCIAMNIGLDNRMLLPPFMPVQRKEDAIFMTVMRSCMKPFFTGLLPYTITHEPPMRAPLAELVFARASRMNRSNDILEWLLASYEAAPGGEDAEQRLESLGRHLVSLSRCSARNFRDHLHSVGSVVIAKRIAKLEQRLDERRGVPAYWARDVQRYIVALQFAATTPDFIAPYDLVGRVEERLKLFQKLVGFYGATLECWAALKSAMDDLSHSQFSLEISSQSPQVV